jgi:hypothetical protein
LNGARVRAGPGAGAAAGRAAPALGNEQKGREGKGSGSRQVS